MMSYTMACTSLCSIAGRLMRRTSPWTRIIGGRPAERWRSEALFLTPNASSSVISIGLSLGEWRGAAAILWGRRIPVFAAFQRPIMTPISANLQAVLARIDAAARAFRPRSGKHRAAGGEQDLAGTMRSRSGRRRPAAFGENYVQEAVDKINELAGAALCAGISSVRCKATKSRLVAEHFDWVHSIDRLKLAERLSQQRPSQRPPLNVCLQVNVSGEATKRG